MDEFDEVDSDASEDQELIITVAINSEATSVAACGEPKLQKTLNLCNVVAFTIGDIVGSGIFITPTAVLRYSGSFGMALVFWVAGGLIALAGGLVYVELGSMIKDSGAEYAYLREGYSFGGKHPALRTLGNTLGFLSVWCTCVLVKPLSVAIVTQVASLYLCKAIEGGANPPDLSVKLVATSSILLISLINMVSMRATAMVINVFTMTKVLALLFISVLGVWQLIVGDHIDNFKNAFEGTSSHPDDIALAFYSILYSYDGWNSIGFVVEETKNAARNLPRGLFIAMPIIIFCYVFANVAYYAGLSKPELLSSPATALVLGEAVLGRVGLIVMPLLVAASSLGAAMFAVYSGPRATFSAARDGNLPEVLCLLQNSSQTPVPAIILQSILSVLFVFSGNINQLINGVGVSLWIFYLLVFIACLIMRFTKRSLYRPFRVWIVVPVLMILISLFLIVVPIILVPDERLISLVVILIILFALPAYLVFGWDRFRPKFIDRFSEALVEGASILFDSSSARIANN